MLNSQSNEERPPGDRLIKILHNADRLLRISWWRNVEHSFALIHDVTLGEVTLQFQAP